MSHDNRDFLDEMMDINCDGKVDSQDMFLNYMIYNEATNDNNCSSPRPKSKGVFSVSEGKIVSNCSPGITAVLIILAIIGWVIFLANACTNNKNSSSYRSYTPHRTYSSYSSSSYTSNNYSSSSGSYSSDSYSSYSGSSKSDTNSEKSDDPYNAKDYNEIDDFYDDNYDDFESFEDAEDYYNDHND